MSATLALLLQVGPNPVPLPPGSEEDILNRQPRNVTTEIADPTAAWLSQCLDQLEEDAARAHTQAQIRRNTVTGADRVVANLCLGLAATELGRWDDSRTAFLAARDETPADEVRARARFAMMAGNAALANGDAQQARALLATALAEARQAASATLQVLAAIDLSRVLVTLDRPEEALAALDTATDLASDNGEAWLLKATLLRRLARLDEAQTAIERAVELIPRDAQVGLEAGVIAVLSGRDEAARQSWQSVIDTQPDSLAAQTAKDYLAQLGPEPAAEPANP
jgi:tetratricopeptide (TPR) repeat protein